MPTIIRDHVSRASLLAAIYTLAVFGATAAIALSAFRDEPMPAQGLAMTDSFDSAPDNIRAEEPAEPTIARR